MGRRVRERFARLVFLSELKLRPPEENSKGAGRRPAVRTAKNASAVVPSTGVTRRIQLGAQAGLPVLLKSNTKGVL